MTVLHGRYVFAAARYIIDNPGAKRGEILRDCGIPPYLWDSVSKDLRINCLACYCCYPTGWFSVAFPHERHPMRQLDQDEGRMVYDLLRQRHEAPSPGGVS